MENVDNVPAGVVQDTGIPVGVDGAAGTTNEGAKTLDVYVDYMCPVCGQFESLNAASITERCEAGAVTLIVHPVAILDRRSSGTEYSTRAAPAAAWVADQAPEQFNAFHEAMFANQPAEDSAGLSGQQLADLAEQAGVPADVADGIANGDAAETYRDWVTASTEQATSAEELANPQTCQFGTPTVMLDDERFDNWSTPGALAAAISGEGSSDDSGDGSAD